jgi:hypothetical protein
MPIISYGVSQQHIISPPFILPPTNYPLFNSIFTHSFCFLHIHDTYNIFFFYTIYCWYSYSSDIYQLHLTISFSVYLFLSLLPHSHSTLALQSFHHPSSTHDQTITKPNHKCTCSIKNVYKNACRQYKAFSHTCKNSYFWCVFLSNNIENASKGKSSYRYVREAFTISLCFSSTSKIMKIN